MHSGDAGADVASTLLRSASAGGGGVHGEAGAVTHACAAAKTRKIAKEAVVNASFHACCWACGFIQPMRVRA